MTEPEIPRKGGNPIFWTTPPQAKEALPLPLPLFPTGPGRHALGFNLAVLVLSLPILAIFSLWWWAAAAAPEPTQTDKEAQAPTTLAALPAQPLSPELESEAEPEARARQL